ncbi:MAG TPA: nucleotidyltransferase substrate binding protein [Pseudobdellovibrionaceae bacterium]|nr:nucleotidyltransferase substrate binding protein [Pseudobdellovibrionaceae bacterium]
MNKINPNRWKQRFSNFQSALVELTEAVQKENLNKLEKQGMIKAFEYTFELGWKTLQDYIQSLGIKDIVGPRPVLMEAFKMGLLSEREKWMELLEDRNQTSHVYNKEVAESISNDIKHSHYHLLKKLEETLKSK